MNLDWPQDRLRDACDSDAGDRLAGAGLVVISSAAPGRAYACIVQHWDGLPLFPNDSVTKRDC